MEADGDYFSKEIEYGSKTVTNHNGTEADFRESPQSKYSNFGKGSDQDIANEIIESLKASMIEEK